MNAPVRGPRYRRGKVALAIGASVVLIVALVAGAVVWGTPVFQWVLEATSPLPQISAPTPTSIINISPVTQQAPTIVVGTATPAAIPTPPTLPTRSSPTSTPTPSTPHLGVSLSSLTSVCRTGQFKSIKVDNTGGGTLYWSATPSITTVTLQPIGGSLRAVKHRR